MKLEQSPLSLRKTVLVLVSLFFFTFQSCKKSHSDIGKIVFQETKNKIFKDIETETFVEKFKATFAKQEKNYRNPKFLKAFYEANDFEPVLLMKDLPQDRLKSAIEVLNNAEVHGLDPAIFETGKLNDLVAKTYNKKEIKTIDEAYQILIDLELSAANSLSNYSNAMQFGLVNPRKIYAQYYTETKRPDSISFLQVFEATDIKAFLDSIQPNDQQYVALQKALKDKTTIAGATQQESERVLRVNLERLRWKNAPTEKKYVWVNIPDYTLNVIEDGKSVLNMKVCVGEGRNKDNTASLATYDENDIKRDKYFNRETPQLKSLIHSVQVNPVWNIPESIATNEISKHAVEDRYYLANNNIDVFLNGQIVEDPETIDWTDASVGKTYSFKQRPGDDNSLGKIKFLFNNQSSVYLHDTPAQKPFTYTMRAVSHGCVRLEKPQELAKVLFGEGTKFDRIKEGMSSPDPVATDISLTKKIPVYLTYQTCWLDEQGTIQFRKDVYGLDMILYTHLQKMA